jgi:hypothetical protein
MPFVGATSVPEALLGDARAIRQRGGKCFLARPEPPGGCTNCNGGGRLILQVVSSGPFDSPVNTRGEGNGQGGESVSIFERGLWYLARTRVYLCPVCGGGNPHWIGGRRPG